MAEACGAPCQTQAMLAQPKTCQGAVGPLLTLVFAAALLWLRSIDVNIPNPILFFANCIVFSAFLGGVGAGLASVAITLVFALLYWSVPGQLFHYAPVDLKRLAVLALTMPPLGLLVGWLRTAYDRKQQELVEQNVQLANELRRKAVLEARQRDVDHILHHDLRAPLTGIIHIPQLLLGDDNLTQQQRELLQLVFAAGRKMLSQINCSLELQQIEEGSYAPQVEPCDPAQILQDNFKIMSISAQTGQPLFQFIEHGPVVLHTDCRILDVIVANLLRNALEASDKGAPVIVELTAMMGACVIVIANNRPVPKKIRARFFEKYVTAGKAGGTGLGTYSAQLMTTAIGGTIAMETSETTGTKVTLRIPLGEN